MFCESGDNPRWISYLLSWLLVPASTQMSDDGLSLISTHPEEPSMFVEMPRTTPIHGSYQSRVPAPRVEDLL